jgi:hypothetical protein
LESRTLPMNRVTGETMETMGPGTLIGIGVGFAWGLGCSLALLYSIYIGGYQKAIEDSLKQDKPRRFAEALEKVQARNA